MDIYSIEQTIKKHRDKVTQLKAQYDLLLSQKLQKEEKMIDIKNYSERLDKARILLIKSGEYQRKKVKKDIEDMVTKALQYILEEDIYFEIEIKEARGRSEAQFWIKSIRNGVVTRTGIEDSRGDGIFDIVTLALNVALLELTSPKIKGPLIFDEPAKQVSKDHIQNIGTFLKEISEAFGRQIIMITHNKELSNIGDSKFLVSLEGTKSKVVELIAAN